MICFVFALEFVILHFTLFLFFYLLFPKNNINIKWIHQIRIKWQEQSCFAVTNFKLTVQIFQKSTYASSYASTYVSNDNGFLWLVSILWVLDSNQWSTFTSTIHSLWVGLFHVNSIYQMECSCNRILMDA